MDSRRGRLPSAPRRLALQARFALALSLAASLTAAPTAPAAEAAPEDPPPAAKAQARTEADVGRAAAKLLWDAAARALRAGLRDLALGEAARTLEQDPDHADARAALGFVRADGAWRKDPAARSAAGRPGLRAKAEMEKAAAEGRRWCRDVRRKARVAAAALWSSFGGERAALGDADGALAAHRRAVALDPEHEASRKALGHFRWEGHWWTEAQYRAVEAAARAAPTDVESPAEKALGGQLTKVESAHFRIEGRLPAAVLADVARAVETAYAVHLLDAGADPTASVFPAKVRFVICASEAEWDAWVDRFVPKEKEFHRGLAGAWAADWHYAMKPPEDGRDDTRRDHLVHRALHAVDSFALGLNWPSWADEGLCHLTAIRLQRMTRTWCLAPTQSEYAVLDAVGAQSGWIEEVEWRTALRTAALARDDVPLRTLVNHPISEQTFAAVMKAWSVLDWWSTEDPASFRALLPELRRAKDPAAVIEARFECSLEELDEAWRSHVLRTY